MIAKLLPAGTRMIQLENGNWRPARTDEETKWTLVHPILLPIAADFDEIWFDPIGDITSTWPVN